MVFTCVMFCLADVIQLILYVLCISATSLLISQLMAISTRSIWKMLGPFATASRRMPLVLHCHSPCITTVASRLRIDVHNNIDNNDNAWQRGPLWPHGMGPTSINNSLSPPIGTITVTVLSVSACSRWVHQWLRGVTMQPFVKLLLTFVSSGLVCSLTRSNRKQGSIPFGHIG